jgi:hypothetical protein
VLLRSHSAFQTESTGESAVKANTAFVQTDRLWSGGGGWSTKALATTTVPYVQHSQWMQPRRLFHSSNAATGPSAGDGGGGGGGGGGAGGGGGGGSSGSLQQRRLLEWQDILGRYWNESEKTCLWCLIVVRGAGGGDFRRLLGPPPAAGDQLPVGFLHSMKYCLACTDRCFRCFALGHTSNACDFFDTLQHKQLCYRCAMPAFVHPVRFNTISLSLSLSPFLCLPAAAVNLSTLGLPAATADTTVVLKVPVQR